MATPSSQLRLIHVAKITVQGMNRWLFLRKIDNHSYMWLEQKASGRELETSISASSPEEAIRLASQNWHDNVFTTLKCGFRYTLPERDEHGINALFHQMAASYNSANGIYFDEELGSNCFVNFASLEARSMMEQLKKQNRL